MYLKFILRKEISVVTQFKTHNFNDNQTRNKFCIVRSFQWLTDGLYNENSLPQLSKRYGGSNVGKFVEFGILRY